MLNFFCFSEVFVDPVSTIDGQTYERSAIVEWFGRGKTTSPATGLALSSTTLIPNFALRSMIDLLRRTPMVAPAPVDEQLIDVYVRIVRGPCTALEVERFMPFPRLVFLVRFCFHDSS